MPAPCADSFLPASSPFFPQQNNNIIILPFEDYTTPGGTNSRGGSSYHYSNQNGSYYYSNDNGSTYYNDGKGSYTYTAPKK